MSEYLQGARSLGLCGKALDRQNDGHGRNNSNAYLSNALHLRKPLSLS
jgi:hypothetical protein